MKRLLLLRLLQVRRRRISRRSREAPRSRRLSRRNRGGLRMSRRTEECQGGTGEICEVEGGAEEPLSERLPSPSLSVDLSERLPLELIMKHLPLRQRVQALCVCKAWNHMLRDSVVAEMEEMQKGLWLLMYDYIEGTGWDMIAYKITGALAEPCSLPSGHKAFGAHVGGGTGGLLMGCNCYTEYDIRDLYMPRLASSGGLMCALLTADAGHVNGNVVVFNCLVGSVKTLPPPLRCDLLFAGTDLYSDTVYSGPCPCLTYMAVDALDPTRYYIMLTHVLEVCENYFTYNDIHAEVFDSKIWGWKDATFPYLFPVPGHSNVWDADFFFIHQGLSNVFNLAAYSVVHDMWSVQHLPEDCSQYIDCGETLFIHKFEGRIFLAIHHESKLHRVGIWEVRRQTASRDAMWVEVASTPPQISSVIENRISDIITVGDMKCGIGADGSCFYFIMSDMGYSVCGIPPLVFDIASNSWYFLQMKEWHSDYRFALVHRPRLSAHI